MPKRESCGSVLQCALPLLDPVPSINPPTARTPRACRDAHCTLLGSPACRHARRPMLRSRLPSRAAPTCNPHNACCQPLPNCPRLRALALFGRRPLQRVVSLVIPPTKNLHRSSHGARLVDHCVGAACVMHLREEAHCSRGTQFCSSHPLG
jgi:hypothetical protein